MLYIKEMNLTREAFKSAIENMKETVENDYYNDCDSRSHALPLAVLNLTMGEKPHVKSGYTVNEYEFIYSTSAGNMSGIFEGWDDKYYFFMVGRRHGVVNTLDYLPEGFIPTDFSNPKVYLSNNTDVDPTTVDAGYGNVRLGAVCSEEMEVDALNVFEEETSTKINYYFKSVLKGTAVIESGELPVDVVDVEINAITIKVGSPAPWAPTVTVDGIRFKAEEIKSDCNGLTLRGGRTMLKIEPEQAGNRDTRIKLTWLPK